MGRNILFITSDQQRYDALGCNGGEYARTPTLDRLAADGVNFRCAYNQNVVCMPSRTSMFTGQHPLTHGVVANGIPYPAADGTGVASWLKRRAGYKTALIGKAHFDPLFDPWFKFRQSQLAAEGSTGPWLGFDFVQLAGHGPVASTHYTRWLVENHLDKMPGFLVPMSAAGGGETSAPETAINPMPRELYHTDWIAERTLEHLDRLDAGDDWFLWLSFPDPHHPFDPPSSELGRIHWRDIELPAGHPGSDAEIRRILAQKPQHWLDYYEGRFSNPEGGPGLTPARLSHDQIREMLRMIHVENELIDEAVARVIGRLRDRGMLEDTDIIYTTDHGDLQGDFGLFFKGPYHVNSLMHVPMIWRPAPSARSVPAEIFDPVGHTDLFPTFCRIAGVPVPDWVQGRELPLAPDPSRERIITAWDSQYRRVGMHLRTICRDGFVLTAYLPSSRDRGGRFPLLEAISGLTGNLAQPEFAFPGRGGGPSLLRALRNPMGAVPSYQGTEGELYDLNNDPLQWRNLWDDPAYQALKSDLRADLFDNMPEERTPPLRVEFPV